MSIEVVMVSQQNRIDFRKTLRVEVKKGEDPIADDTDEQKSVFVYIMHIAQGEMSRKDHWMGSRTGFSISGR